MIYPTLTQAKEILDNTDYRRIPMKLELYADSITPIIAVQKFKKVSQHCFMLESAHASQQWGRYTFIGFEPTLEITCENHMVTIKEKDIIQKNDTDPSTALRNILKDNKAPILAEMPPFSGGLVGYFSYDYIKYSEPTLCLNAQDEENFKDMDLMLFDKIIAFDHFRQKIILIVNIETQHLEQCYEQGKVQLQKMKQILQFGEMADNPPLQVKSKFEPLFSKTQYCNMVEKSRKYIYEGDIFQVVLSNRMHANIEGTLFDTYRVLRTTNPSPYMFYFSSDDVEIAGASPETLIKLENGTLHAFPLAGTRPRGKTKEEDDALEQDLLQDEKEVAEHNMLVDLGRNDIGKISKIGTVAVEKYMSVEKFSHVMHIGSTVRGELAQGKDALDAIDAILPAGTLSGAPKLRACEIINELENNKRGIYGGAIGYLDFTGNMDTCIAIRLAFSKNGKVFIRSGAGIVADSVAETEYQECINKAKAVMLAIEIAEGGIDQ